MPEPIVYIAVVVFFAAVAIIARGRGRDTKCNYHNKPKCSPYVGFG